MFFSKAKHKGGSILRLLNTGDYLHVKSVRRIKPTGERKRQWAYDGLVFRGRADGEIEIVTGVTCVLERSVVRVSRPNWS